MRAHALPTDFHLQLSRHFPTYFEAPTQKRLKWLVALTVFLLGFPLQVAVWLQ